MPKPTGSMPLHSPDGIHGPCEHTSSMGQAGSKVAFQFCDPALGSRVWHVVP